MFLTKLAFKNLARHRNRTLITAVIIAFAIFFYILLDSMVGGMTEMSYQTIIDYEAGHLQVVNEAYWEEEEKLPLENLLPDEARIRDNIRKIDGYLACSPELNFQARLNYGGDELPVIGKGILPEDFLKVFPWEGQLIEGRMFAPGESRAVLGKRLAELMELRVGDYVTLLVKDKNRTFNTIEAEIAGLVHTTNPNVNQNYVYLPLGLAQEALNVGSNVSKIIVRLENKKQAPAVAVGLERELTGNDGNPGVYSWNEIEAVSFVEAQKIENQVILTIILAIAAIAIINTVILAALERREEIGMMKAMGLRNIEIVYTFVLESVGIGALGGMIGIVLGFAGVWMMVARGIDFEALYGLDLASFGMPVIGKVYGVWNPAAFIKVYTFGIIVSFLASIFPARRAAVQDPVKTIYHR
ncbi:MAG: ABC transporter permease [Firmicutes bacterium]|nr:ABC transporter permease [Bacillota bacterium]